MTLAADFQVEYGGQRMCWWAVSDRARAWADAHPAWLEDAPEGVECLISYAEPIIAKALISGLVVKAGDVEVTLC